MAGRGPAPKPDATRARRNRHTTAASLPSESEMRSRLRGKRLPKLPEHPEDRPWDKRTVDWWREVMRSPMAQQYLAEDREHLAMVFELIDEFYHQLGDDRERKGRIGRLVMLSTEIRQQVARFGLAPRDRLSLHWHVPIDDDEPSKAGPSRPPNIADFRDTLGGEESA